MAVCHSDVDSGIVRVRRELDLDYRKEGTVFSEETAGVPADQGLSYQIYSARCAVPAGISADSLYDLLEDASGEFRLHRSGAFNHTERLPSHADHWYLPEYSYGHGRGDRMAGLPAAGADGKNGPGQSHVPDRFYLRACWHLPILTFGDYMEGAPVWYKVPAFILCIVPVGIMTGYLTYKSKSVWPAAFLHAAHNNFDQAVFGVITRGEDKMYFVSETGCLTILCAWIMAVIILIMIRKDADQKVFD